MKRAQPTDLERPLKGEAIWTTVLLDVALWMFMVGGAGSLVGLILMAFYAVNQLGTYRPLPSPVCKPPVAPFFSFLWI